MFRLESFSWRKKEDARRIGLPALSYACDSINQHSSSWCGCCYIVAVTQVIEDRGNIAMVVHASKLSGSERIPILQRISTQSVANHFQSWNEESNWNVCHGGAALQVLECFQQGSCPLVLEMPATGRSGFLGFAKRIWQCDVSNVPQRISSFGRISESRVKHSGE